MSHNIRPNNMPLGWESVCEWTRGRKPIARRPLWRICPMASTIQIGSNTQFTVEADPYLSNLTIPELQETLNWAISVHASVVEDQGEQISAQDLPYVERGGVMQIGYRYELTNLSYSATATPGDPWP